MDIGEDKVASRAFRILVVTKFVIATMLLFSVSPVQAATKKQCTASQEIAILNFDRSLLSLNNVLRDQNLTIQVNQELLNSALATNNSIESSRLTSILSDAKQNMNSTLKSISQISSQKSKMLSSCTSKPKKVSDASVNGTNSGPSCSPSQTDLIKSLAQQHLATQNQIQDQELEIYRQQKLAKQYISQGRTSDSAKANFEIQRLSVKASSLSAYMNVIKRQFEVANSSCSNSGIQLADLLSRVFVPDSLVGMNINRFESVNHEQTKPFIGMNSGNLSISCESNATDYSAYANVGVYFALTTKKPAIWDRYNGVGVDSDAFTKAEFQPTYLKNPDISFSLVDYNGKSAKFNAFKAQIKPGGTREICGYEIVPINPSAYSLNAVGIWYFLLASNQPISSGSFDIWNLSGFTIDNYLNPLKL